MSNWVCAAITYASGDYAGDVPDVHSDVCPPGCSPANLSNPEWRQFFHDTLDNWLDRSGGTGYFAIGGANLWDALNREDGE